MLRPTHAWKRRLALIAGLMALAPTLIPVSPAGAGTGNLVCDDGEACVWSDDGFQGCFADFLMPSKESNFNDGDPRWTNCDGNLNDKISSYQNRSQFWFFMFEDEDYQRNKFCGMPGGSSGDLRKFGSFDDRQGPEDRMSSYSYGRGAPPACVRTDNGPRCCDWRDEN